MKYYRVYDVFHRTGFFFPDFGVGVLAAPSGMSAEVSFDSFPGPAAAPRLGVGVELCNKGSGPFGVPFNFFSASPMVALSSSSEAAFLDGRGSLLFGSTPACCLFPESIFPPLSTSSSSPSDSLPSPVTVPPTATQLLHHLFHTIFDASNVCLPAPVACSGRLSSFRASSLVSMSTNAS